MHPRQDIGASLIKLFRSEFFRLFKKKDQHNFETRLRNARFIAELTKFKVGPSEQFLVFDVLHTCLDEIGHTFNIDLICCVLESCGRWLYMKADTQLRLVAVLDRLMSLKKAKVRDVFADGVSESNKLSIVPHLLVMQSCFFSSFTPLLSSCCCTDH